LGLVGERRERVVPTNATAHPRYRRSPETGDEPFDAFPGVPLIHDHNVLGVLVVWRKEPDQFILIRQAPIACDTFLLHQLGCENVAVYDASTSE
jgi:signal transduction protein with GAF and PtsI domain